jgi:hypothetical protein
MAVRKLSLPLFPSKPRLAAQLLHALLTFHRHHLAVPKSAWSR